VADTVTARPVTFDAIAASTAGGLMLALEPNPPPTCSEIALLGRDREGAATCPGAFDDGVHGAVEQRTGRRLRHRCFLSQQM
jgi:hypothetical protein